MIGTKLFNLPPIILTRRNTMYPMQPFKFRKSPSSSFAALTIGQIPSSKYKVMGVGKIKVLKLVF